MSNQLIRKPYLLIILMAILTMSCDEDRYRGMAIAEGPTRVYSNYNEPDQDPKLSLVVLQKGESVDVLTKVYGKDSMYFKVRLKDGRTGYLLYHGDKFRVVPKGPQGSNLVLCNSE